MVFKEYTGKVIPADGGFTEYTGEVVPMEAGAGAGRGRINPPAGAPPMGLADARPVPQATVPAAEAVTGDPMGMGGAEIMQAPRPRESVLQDAPMPVPEFDAAESNRLSTRAYADNQPLLSDPRFSAPSLRQSPGIERTTQATQRGQALQDMPLPVRAAAKAVSGIAQGAGGTMRMAGDLTGINSLARAGAETVKGADQFEKGMGDIGPIDGFGPKSPAPYLANMAEGAASSLGQSALFASAFGAGAVIPLMSIQTAGQEYDKARNAGLDPATALAGAVPKGIFEAVGEKFTGLDKVAGSMGVLLNRGASAADKRLAGQVLARSGIREIPGEVITYLGQTGVDLLPGIGLNPNMSMSQFLDGLRDTVVQAGMMGGAMGAGARHVANSTAPDTPTAQQLAKDKGFLVKEQVQRMREAGDTAAADKMQKGLDRQTAIESAGTELAGMAEVAPDQAFHANPAFQDGYRQMRAEGTKPAEASARAAMASGFNDLGQQAGLTPKAMQAATEAAKGMELDKVPGFLEKFVAKLTGAGMGQALPAGTVASAVSAQGDSAMTAAMESVYRDAPPTADILEMEQKQDQANINSAQTAINSEAPAAHVGAELLRPIDQAAHEAATSPLNDLPEPTDAQKEAGNYKVGRVNLHGLAISIENPMGSERSGTGPDGKRWSNTLQSHYGYIRGTEGNDGDHVDTFIGGNPDSQKVFVVDQVNKNGSFDEHKILLGFNSLQEADAGYHANYHAGWTGRGAITEVPLDEFKTWVRDGVKTKPFAAPPDASANPIDAAPGQKPAADRLAEPVGTAQQPDAALEPLPPTADQQPVETINIGATGTKPQGGKTLRRTAYERNPLMTFLAKNGLYHEKDKPGSQKSEFSPDKQLMVMGYGPVFRRTGMKPDVLVQRAIEDGYLPQDGNEQQLTDLIRRAVAGEKIMPLYAEGVAEAEGQRLADQHLEMQADLAHNDNQVFDAADEGQDVQHVQAVSDAVLFDLDDNIPAFGGPSNVSRESTMRSMGFTEQEIQDEAAQRPRGTQESGVGSRQPDEAATGQAPPDRGQRDAQARPAAQPDAQPAAQPLSAQPNPQTPANAGVSASGFQTALRPSGTLAVKGNANAILEALNAAGITRMTPMDGGYMVGKTQAQKALAALEGRPADVAAPKALSIGMTPATAEAVTVKAGVVHIGKNEAIDFDSGEPVRVAQAATDAEIVQALRGAGALSRHARVFGLGKTGSTNLNDGGSGVENISPNNVKSGDAQNQQSARNDALIELRKRVSVLNALRKCLGTP